MSALSCPGVPFQNVKCESYTDFRTVAIQADGYTGASGPAEVYTVVDLRSAPRWCVTSSLRSTVEVELGSGPTGFIDLGAELLVAKYTRDGDLEREISMGSQYQTVAPSTVDTTLAAFSTSAMADLSRGLYRFSAVQSYSDHSENIDASSRDATISVVAIPLFTPGV